MLNKKADVVIGVIIIIILILIFLGWLIHEGQKECRSNKDCKTNEYCGSDFACHNIPKTEPSPPGDYTNAAWIIGISLIVAALILKWDSIFGKKTKEENEKKERYKINRSHLAEEQGLYEEDLEK